MGFLQPEEEERSVQLSLFHSRISQPALLWPNALSGHSGSQGYCWQKHTYVTWRGLVISRPKSSGRLVVIPRPQVIETDAAVVPLPAVTEAVRSRTARLDRHSKGVIVILVRHRAGRIRQETDIPVTCLPIRVMLQNRLRMGEERIE